MQNPWVNTLFIVLVLAFLLWRSWSVFRLWRMGENAARQLYFVGTMWVAMIALGVRQFGLGPS
jgi:hypothetical protein